MAEIKTHKGKRKGFTNVRNMVSKRDAAEIRNMLDYLTSEPIRDDAYVVWYGKRPAVLSPHNELLTFKNNRSADAWITRRVKANAKGR